MCAAIDVLSFPHSAVKPSVDAVPEIAQRIDRLCELNVIEQVANVCQTTVVRDAWERGQPLALGFSHPEYPLGLPLLYASVSFLLGRWDDHALALLYPFFQIATLLALAGWLRRRGASATLALAAAALLAQFEPLYSAFQTGLADIPFSFAALLFGSALVDVLDGTDPQAARRLALAAFLALGFGSPHHEELVGRLV